MELIGEGKEEGGGDNQQPEVDSVLGPLVMHYRGKRKKRGRTRLGMSYFKGGEGGKNLTSLRSHGGG